MNRGISEGQGSAVIWQHFYGGAHSSEQEIIRHFEENARHLAFRKNGNVLYHEFISFSAGHYLRQAELTNIVADIGQEYLRLRAPEQLAYGVVHFDTEHIHLHLMISANSVGRSERVRLSKKVFADIQKQLESFVLERYPDMAQTPVYREIAQREQCKRSADEQAMIVRTNLPSRKDLLTERLLCLFM
ncbi:MAG: relaxase/mobilization nuclease domain-containing protein, partial [Burkholderiales bacterium]|nr:relaxase/mobilization nuclease domain-containing protein [Burkholderiales bacterium]